MELPAQPVTTAPFDAAQGPLPGAWTGALRVFDLSVGQMLWSRRTVFMALVVGLPVLVSAILRILVGLGVPVVRPTGDRAGACSA